MFTVGQIFISLESLHWKEAPLLQLALPSVQTGILAGSTVPQSAMDILLVVPLKQIGSESLLVAVQSFRAPLSQEAESPGFVHVALPSSQ